MAPRFGNGAMFFPRVSGDEPICLTPFTVHFSFSLCERG